MTEFYNYNINRTLSIEEMREQYSKDGVLHGDVNVTLEDILSENEETFSSFLSYLLTGNGALREVDYEIIGFNGSNNELILLVSGDGEEVMKWLDTDEIEKEKEEEITRLGRTDPPKVHKQNAEST